MKPAFQKNDAFLNDVRRAVADGSRKLWWLGQSGFLVVNRGRALVLDPYLSDSLTSKYAGTEKPHVRITERVVDPVALGALGVINAVTSSHNHTDHLDAETLSPLLASNPDAKLVVPAANRNFVIERLGAGVAARLVEVDAETSATAAGIQFHGIAAAHNMVERDSAGRCKFLGYVIRWDELTLYHSGDTMLHDGLVPALKPFAIDVALLPINGDRPERRVAGNLDGRQAAQLAHEIGARLAVPCHFDLFEFNTASPDEFVAECQRIGQPFRLLDQGESFDA
jgi:L-ascorbate metabolism protein UlaG (beta-lactamase superfamily)